MIVNEKLVWAYEKSTTHRTNGIKTGTTYEVVLNTYDKKNFHISVANEQTAQDVLQHISQKMPWTAIGYNDELNRMFRQDFQNFLNLRYNKRENEVL